MKVLRMSFYINEGYTTEGYIFALIITMTIIKPGWWCSQISHKHKWEETSKSLLKSSQQVGPQLLANIEKRGNETPKCVPLVGISVSKPNHIQLLYNTSTSNGKMIKKKSGYAKGDDVKATRPAIGCMLLTLTFFNRSESKGSISPPTSRGDTSTSSKEWWESSC